MCWLVFIFSALIAFPLFSTVNEPLLVECISGYRNDRLHWHLQEGGTGLLNYSEVYRNLQFWENGLSIRTIQRDFVLFARGSYAAFGKGEGVQRYAQLPFASVQPEFQCSTSGWAADMLGYFGMAVNLTADRAYKVILAPLVGCSGHFEYMHRGDIHPSFLQSNHAVGADSFVMESFLPKTLHSTWYGVFLGAEFIVEPVERISFRGGYSYHWLHARFKTRYQDVFSLFNSSLIQEGQSVFYVQANQGGNLGQTGWAQANYALSLFWDIGFGLQIHYFSTSLLETSLYTQEEQRFPIFFTSCSKQSQKLKVRWTSVSGWFMVARAF